MTIFIIPARTSRNHSELWFQKMMLQDLLWHHGGSGWYAGDRTSDSTTRCRGTLWVEALLERIANRHQSVSALGVLVCLAFHGQRGACLSSSAVASSQSV